MGVQVSVESLSKCLWSGCPSARGIRIEEMLKDPDAPTVGESAKSATEAEDETAQAVALNIDKTKRSLKALLGEDMKTGWPIQTG